MHLIVGPLICVCDERSDNRSRSRRNRWALVFRESVVLGGCTVPRIGRTIVGWQSVDLRLVGLVAVGIFVFDSAGRVAQRWSQIGGD